MANRQKYPPLQLRSNSYEVAEMREPSERIRTIGVVNVDRSVFKKSKSEKYQLKLAKLQCKIDELNE